ncbi:gcn5-related n-acetyltransferase [Flavobacterium limnosediminis JC2902]|uniref:Gcn5-related n-acetyltransferase n=1 Tax=Flavobacterium limnosediminis JC2902 TaxID=1341181 RepID=V6SWK6_9FLAO|nr:GNAT family N-acetyltransferase [Flavobacterium limnosediminis]ESU28790.1 gcn5-related n-acetyltransferase [Flavobacterium limnosediminis JC2902]
MTTRIITFQPQYKDRFISLNKAWLEEFFFVEPHDIEVFENIEEVVLKPGGEIFFCLIDDEVAGTVAMQKVNDSVYEMAKLAVDKKFQGQKLSNLLIDACIDFAKEKKAEKIMLLSSTKLIPALNLYRKYNFKETPMDETDYARADIQMELYL